MSRGPLAGLRVIDFSRLLPGPFGSLMLADMGAEVVQFEDPDFPDNLRVMPPYGADGVGAYFTALHRNKGSLLLSLSSEAGRDSLHRLLPGFDVLIESFRPGVMRKLGLDYASLQDENPRLVYCSISGFGQEGPRAQRPGHDINYLAAAGMAASTGQRKGELAVPGFQTGDVAGGSMMAVIGILAALRSRDSTGRGQHVDVSMTDSLVALQPLQAAAYFATGEVDDPGRGHLNGGLASYRYYRCSDGRHLSLGALELKFWKGLWERLGEPCPPLPQPGPAGIGAESRLEAIFQTRTSFEWKELLEEAGCCVELVRDLGEVLDSDAAGLVQDIPGEGRYLGFPIKFSG